MPTSGTKAAAPPISSAEQTAIAAVPSRMVAAWAAHDAQAFAELFTQDGTLIMPGVYKKGHQEIREFMAAGYAGPYQGTRVVGSPIDVKPLADGAVALLTTGGVLAPVVETVPDCSDQAAIRASWILVKRDGEWRLAVYQNCPRQTDTVRSSDSRRPDAPRPAAVSAGTGDDDFPPGVTATHAR